MDCREVQSNYVAFIDDRLTMRQLTAFLRHLESCEDCREEFDFYYTMIMGMRYLDGDGKTDSHIDPTVRLQDAKQTVWKFRFHFLQKIVLLLVICLGIILLS